MNRTTISHSHVRRGLPALLALAAIVAMVASVPVASARGTYDLRGSWSTRGSGTPGVIKITAMNLATGAFSGTSYGGMFKVKGRESGSQISFTQSEPGYVATDAAAIAVGGRKMINGAWHDTNGSGGTWAAVKTAGPKPAPHKKKHPAHHRPKKPHPAHHKPHKKHHPGS